jgi:CheY-like chemotaxis protein
LSTYILVVDDEPDVENLFRQQFRRDIRSERFVMEFAASAPEALERAKTIADPLLILILSDINMPGMSGLEMLPRVKAARPNVPVIMITAYGDEATKRKAVGLGAAGLLTKPIDFGKGNISICGASSCSAQPLRNSTRLRSSSDECHGAASHER